MDKPTPPKTITTRMLGTGPEVVFVLLTDAIAHGEAMAAWGAAQTIDCRTCQNHTTRSGGCMSTVLCVDAAQYRPSTPARYWAKQEVL